MKKKSEQQEPDLAFIDRIEAGIAVIVFSDETSLDVPLKKLPENSQAGDYVNVIFDAAGKAIEFTPNVAAKEKVTEHINELQAELQKNSDADQTTFKL